MGTSVIFLKYVCFLPIIFSHVQVSGLSPYSTYYIESDKTCTMNSLQTRLLKLSSKSGIIVQENYVFDRGSLSGKYPYKCLFKVEAASDAGIFAVIQDMKLRKNETSGECIDYVQFRRSNSIQIPIVNFSLERKDERPWSTKVCGKVDAKAPDLTTFNFADPLKLLPYAFMDSEGKIDVRIYVANVSRSPDTELDLKIAFTAFHECGFVPNSQYKKCNPSTCIWNEFFNDNILNCPFTSCSDIGGCQLIYEANFKPSTGLATKIMVGAVAGVFTMFIVFILFLWLFRHCAICWNGSATNAQNTTQMRPIPTAEEIQPTAPPRSLSIDKDLPPSYESLFPNT